MRERGYLLPVYAKVPLFQETKAPCYTRSDGETKVDAGRFVRYVDAKRNELAAYRIREPTNRPPELRTLEGQTFPFRFRSKVVKVLSIFSILDN